MPAVNWFPGHMAKLRRELVRLLRLADVVLEVADARLPAVSRNPLLAELVGSRRRLLLLNKADLAEPAATATWREAFTGLGEEVFVLAEAGRAGYGQLRQALRRLGEELPGRALRAVVVGIPNVGKSTVINRLGERSRTATGARPGITRGPQWVRLPEGLDLLDTPGLLWPRLEPAEAGIMLAATGAIPEDVYDSIEVLVELLKLERGSRVRVAVEERYGLAPGLTGEGLIDSVGRSRGCLGPGGRVNLEAAARIILKEFRRGTLTAVTLEAPPGGGQA